MFVTRAGRHDKADLQEFVSAQRAAEVDTSRGTAMIAREGAIIGCIRIVEVAPNTLVYDDLLVADGRGEAVSRQLVQAAMNNKGGTVYCAADSAAAASLAEFGFAPIDPSEAPDGVNEYWRETETAGDFVFLKAR